MLCEPHERVVSRRVGSLPEARSSAQETKVPFLWWTTRARGGQRRTRARRRARDRKISRRDHAVVPPV